jgi:hypothetical protein
MTWAESREWMYDEQKSGDTELFFKCILFDGARCDLEQ